MVRIQLLIIGLLISTIAYSQQIGVVQTLTASGTVNGTANVVLVTSGTNITVTLPTSSVGRIITIVNHSSGDLFVSPAIKITNDKSSALVSKYISEFLPGISSNKITVMWDGTFWRLIN